MNTYLKYKGDGASLWTADWDDAQAYSSEADAIAEIKAKSIEGIQAQRKADGKWLIQKETQMQTQQQPKASNWNGRMRRPGGGNQAGATTPNPFQQQIKGDAIDNLSNALSNAFSPGGLIAFGAGVFGSALLLNMGFWGSVLSQMPVSAHIEKVLMGEWAVAGAVLAGWGISWGTTLFQTYPYVGKKDGESIVKQYVASMLRPDLTKYKGGDHDIAQAHNQIASDFWKFMGVMWLACTVLETLGGVIFIGDIFGKGLGSLLGIFGFIYSIAGCQWGAYLMIMGRNQRLNKDGRGVINQMNSAAAIAAKAQLK